MDIKKSLENLQDKPFATRVKILWLTVGVVAIGLIIIFIFNLKSTVSNLSVQDLINLSNRSSQTDSEQLETQLIQVERIEKANNSFKIYFNVNNESQNILNFPKSEDITLTVEDRSYHPRQISDRQGEPFVQKILSRTQNFGILIFDSINGDEGKLILDNLTFEESSATTLKQELDLDFKQLLNPVEVRN